MKVAVVLGNRNNDDGTISKECKERVWLLIKADRIYNFDKVILSGGSGLFRSKKRISEAALMYKCLKENDFDLSKVILEERSTTTKENVKYSLEVMSKLNVKNIIIITSDKHLQRKWSNPVELFKKQLKGSNIKLSIYSKDTVQSV